MDLGQGLIFLLKTNSNEQWENTIRATILTTSLSPSLIPQYNLCYGTTVCPSTRLTGITQFTQLRWIALAKVTTTMK